MIGSNIAHYEITANIGQGGMGEVYRAVDTKLGREVAIKVLPNASADDLERLAALCERPEFSLLSTIQILPPFDLVAMSLTDRR